MWWFVPHPVAAAVSGSPTLAAGARMPGVRTGSRAPESPSATSPAIHPGQSGWPCWPWSWWYGSCRLSLSSVPHQDNTRISSAGCLGELCAFLTEEELSAVLQQCLLGRSPLPWGPPAGPVSPFPGEASLSWGIELLKQNGVSSGPVALCVSAQRTQLPV